MWCLRNSYTFVALKLAWGEARGRECIPGDTRPTEQRSPRPISAQPRGRPVFWAEALLLAPYRSTAGYARRSYGNFLRSFTLPDGADGSKGNAEVKDGVLKVHLPKSEKAKPKAAEVKEPG